MLLKIFLRKRQYWLKKPSRQKNRLFPWLVPVIVVSIWLGYKQFRSLETPQAVLMLGGSTSALEREKFTAIFARQYPDLPIWISSGGSAEDADHYNDYVKRVFAKGGIDPNRLHLDEQAVDTVTNFTTLADELKSRGISRVYLVTADYHMLRARVIGEIVFGSRGIDFQPLAVPTQRSPEPIAKSLRDAARSIIWVATGYTGVTPHKSAKSLKK